RAAATFRRTLSSAPVSVAVLPAPAEIVTSLAPVMTRSRIRALSRSMAPSSMVPARSASLPPTTRPGPSCPAHTYRLSKALGQALAQAFAYRERLTRFPDVSETVYGIPNARYPRLIIVLGRTEDLDPHKKDVLRELNRTMHRAHIVGYDALAQQARKTLANIMEFLAAPSDSPSFDATDPDAPGNGIPALDA
ncbi:MAG: DUF4263 domain-containing protein, partial [Actinomycetota bacterium]|nr:DUF4263 domain-containing protein [Actinomycetota bacterium]